MKKLLSDFLSDGLVWWRCLFILGTLFLRIISYKGNPWSSLFFFHNGWCVALIFLSVKKCTWISRNIYCKRDVKNPYDPSVCRWHQNVWEGHDWRASCCHDHIAYILLFQWYQHKLLDICFHLFGTDKTKVKCLDNESPRKYQ